MKDRGATTSRKVSASRQQRPGGSHVPFAGAVTLALLCSAAAYYVGDRAGYARGNNAVLAAAPLDPIDKMDCMARVHRAVTAPRPDTSVKPLPPPPPSPADLSFHEKLKGGAPHKPLDRPADPLTTGSKTFVSAAPVAPPRAEAVPKAPSAGLAQTPGAGDLALQVGAFPNKEDALRLHEKLKAAGLKPVIVPSELNGSTWYRVRVGRFADRVAADAGARALESQVAVSGVQVKH